MFLKPVIIIIWMTGNFHLCSCVLACVHDYKEFEIKSSLYIKGLFFGKTQKSMKD